MSKPLLKSALSYLEQRHRTGALKEPMARVFAWVNGLKKMA